MGQDPSPLVEHRPVGAEEVEPGEEGAALEEGVHGRRDAPHRGFRPDDEVRPLLGEAFSREAEVNAFVQLPLRIPQGVEVALDQEGFLRPRHLGQGQKPKEGPGEEGP
ncbi:hypothetical protein QT17_08005 [Thermus sp. 2.9]|nr:hypothetical protein QT17_08005 [Thermus sp. 2.9]